MNETTHDNHPSGFWRSRRVCVMRQHGAGFLGSFVVANCASTAQRDITDLPRRADYDLVQADAIRRLLSDARPDVLIHLAARVGGIGANREHPAEFFGACPELAEGTT